MGVVARLLRRVAHGPFDMYLPSRTHLTVSSLYFRTIQLPSANRRADVGELILRSSNESKPQSAPIRLMAVVPHMAIHII